MANPTQLRTRLRQLLAGPDMVVAPEAVNTMAGRLIEEAGFPMAYIGGSAQCLLGQAIPDYGLVSPSEIAEAAARIAGELQIPVLVDADQGGETYLGVRRTVQRFEQAGLAGLHIEDSANPKHVGGISPPPVSVREMCDRVRAAVDARRDDALVIVARTDLAYNAQRGAAGGAPFSLQEVIDRGCAYAEAGADAFFSCLTPTEALAPLARALPVPLLDINHPAPAVQDTGLRIDLFAGQFAPAFVSMVDRMLERLRQDGFIDREAVLPAPALRDRLLRTADYIELAKKWAVRGTH